MCHIVTVNVNELPAGAMPCLGHGGEVADPESDAGIVLKRLVIEAEGGPAKAFPKEQESQILEKSPRQQWRLHA
jgi:hypothetical protein